MFSIQEFSDAGLPLALGRLYTYTTGTTTQKTAYTDPAGLVPHTYTSDGLGGQYIGLNSRGELPAPLYLLADSGYDLALKRADGSSVWTRRADGVASASAGFFTQAGSGGVSRTAQTKMRERWSLEDDGALGDGSTDDRASIQSVLNDLSSAGGGICYGVPGKTYVCKKKAGVTKSVGSVTRSYGLEIPSNVVIDLQGATIKAEAAVDYVLISNPASGTGTANNTSLGIINGTIDYNQASISGAAQGVAFYGVRKLQLDKLEIKNGYNIALDLEACDQGSVGRVTFTSCTGAAFYMGGATASGGAACDKMEVGTIVAYNTADHPTNSGLPGNPCLINATSSQFGSIAAFSSDAGIKVTAGNNLQFGKILYDTGNKQNSGFKIQGASETQMIERVTVGEVLSKDCPGVGLFSVWCRNVQIGSYIGKGNVSLGLDVDASISGEVKISNFESIDCGRIALELTTTSGNNFNRSPTCTIDNLKVLNPWSVATSATAQALAVTNGTLSIGLLDIADTRSTPKLVRYFSSSGTKENAITVDECRLRGPSSNPDFVVTGMLNAFVGKPDISALTFPAATLTLGSSALGTGVAVSSTAAPFLSTDVGKLIVAQDGRGVSEITAFTDTSNVTVSNRIAWAGGTSIASASWYIDRATGGRGTFAPAGAATSTTATDAGFVNTTSRGQPLIQVIPTNAAARTLGVPVFDTFATGSVTFKHAAAAGTETYQYRVLGWTN